ncbi:MAG: hypothetical protein ABIU84_04245, partial [Thermoanaerobaculia bacterium]
MRELSTIALLVGWLLLPSGSSAAEPVCAATSLLAGVRPSVSQRIEGEATRLSDGQVAPEGGIWNSALALRMVSAATFLTFELDSERTVRSLLIQADADDTYLVEGSLDGVVFTRLGEAPRLASQHGLRSRALRTPPTPVRFLRVSSSSGDGLASISEFQAFCTEPRTWDPQLQIVDTPAAQTPEPSARWWNDISSRWWELALALLGIALLLWDGRRHRRKPSSGRRMGLRFALFAVVGVVSSFTYFNFGAFHFGSFIHGWDSFHYYVGAKYFRELSYDRLYDCTTVADATHEVGESVAAFDARSTQAAQRKIRNLRTNQLEATGDLLAHPERCTAQFTPERWQAFRDDVAWFRGRESVWRWNELLIDHGFNATPVWNIAGSLLANTGPASDRQIVLLALVDPLYFAAMIGVLLWAFGVPGAAVGLLVLATEFPARFFWTGGAYLRWDWLFFTVAAVACLRRGRPLLGGAAFAYAALLRVFPIFLALGPAAIAGAALFREMRAAQGPFGARLRAAFAAPALRPQLRFVAGALIATAVLVPASLVVTGGPQAYRHFLVNT